MRSKNFLALLFGLLLFSLLHLLVYATGRNAQYHRSMMAPTQRAEEIAYAIAKGAEPKSILPAADTDLFTAPLLSTFVLDSAGLVLAANTQVAQRRTPVPTGLLPHAQRLGLKQVLWLPWPGLQKSLAIRYVPGRNLYIAVAGPYDDTVDESVIGFHVVTWVAGFLLLLLYAFLTRRQQKP
jgi:hypothetical protein